MRVSRSFFSTAGRRTPESNLFAKGNGLFGALGHGTVRDAVHFTPIDTSLITENPKFKAVSAGWGHSAAITDAGNLAVFGRPFDFLSLLRLNRIRRASKTLARWLTEFTIRSDDKAGVFPTPVIFLDTKNIISVACSAAFTVALSSDGNVYTLGSNRWGQCGADTASVPTSFVPHRVPLEAKIVKVDTGLQHCAAVGEDGRVYSWGKGHRGQLGDGSNDEVVHVPRRVGGLKEVVSISSGFGHSAAITKDGSLFVWGRGLSLDRRADKRDMVLYTDQLTPRKIRLPGDRKAVQVICSIFTTVVLANDNTLWAMGLGEHDRNSVIDPIPVLRPLPPEEAEKPSTDEESVKLFDVPADLTGAMLKKGYNRVSVFYPAGMSPYSTDKTKGDHYDVVLHAGLAYFLPLQLDVPMVPVGTDSPLPSLALPTASDVDVESGENKFVEAPVLDYSCGANHTLVLLK